MMFLPDLLDLCTIWYYNNKRKEDRDMSKHKKKEKQNNKKVEATKWAAIAAWAVPAYPIAETIRIVVKHFLK